MGFEPTTFCLGSRHSTPELHPLTLGDGTVPRYRASQILSGSVATLKELSQCKGCVEMR